MATVLSLLFERKRTPAPISSEGWRTLRPSWTLRLVFSACIALTALIVFFLLSGGSTRPDAVTQDLSACALAAFFGLGAAYLWWMMYGYMYAWKGDELRIRGILGREIFHPLSGICSIKRRDNLGDYKIEFSDGSRLSFSAYLLGGITGITVTVH